jgi:hypothetical protein
VRGIGRPSRILHRAVNRAELGRESLNLRRIGSQKKIRCASASEIVALYAFSKVKAVACSGPKYQFEARRGPKVFCITLKAADGELVEVKRQGLTAPN